MLEKNMDEIVKHNHNGSRCWVNFQDVCQQAYCATCQTYLDAVGNAINKIIENGENRASRVLAISS